MDIENVKVIKDMMGEFLAGMEELKRVSTESDPVHLGQPLAILQTAFDLFQGMVNEELVKVGERVNALEERQDKLEQYSRRNCLLFRGLQESVDGKDDENSCLKLVMNVMKNQLSLNLPDSVVERCHRLGSKRSDGKTRAIIVKFYSYRYRHEVFSNKRALKGTGVTITEFLTKNRMDVLNKAKDLHGPDNVWTSDGKILIKIPLGVNKDKRVVVTSVQEIPCPPGGSANHVGKQAKKTKQKTQPLVLSKPTTRSQVKET